MAQAPDLSMFTKGEIREILSGVRNPLSIAIFGTENGFNAGAIVRTAHQFLVRDIYLVDCEKIYEKAAMGTNKWENIHKLSMAEFVNNIVPTHNVVICERRAELKTENLAVFKHPENPVFCFGSEKTGIPDSVLELPNTRLVSIPQFGILNDLNLACAAGIVMYDWVLKNKFNT